MGIRFWQCTGGLVLATITLTGCGLLGDPPGATQDSTSAAAQPMTSPTASPTAVLGVEDVQEPLVTPTAAALRPVVLAGGSVADIAVGDPEPVLRLTELLGEPEVRRDLAWYELCGSGSNTSVGWGDLTISMDRGALLGWDVAGKDIPQNVELPFGLEVGDPLLAVVEATGSAPEYWDWLGRYVTERDGVHWWTDSDQADAPVTGIAADFVWCD